MMKRLFSFLLAVLLCTAGFACAADQQLILPADTTTIQAQAFYNTTRLSQVVLPEGLQTIESKAFAYSSVTAVNLPASLTFIASDAFEGCQGLVATVYEGTLGESYVISHGIRYVLLTAGAVDAGVYTLMNEKTESYLSWDGRRLLLSDTPHQWKFHDSGLNGFHVFAGETNLLLDIDNAYVAVGTTIKLWEQTGYDVQIWHIKPNSNGTYSILYSGDNRYCLGMESGNAVLQLRNTANAGQEWRLACVSASGPKEYLSVKGRSGIVELRLPTDITSVISESRLQQWADDLETAYATFYELTQYLPYSCIVVEAYKPSQYVGWVSDGSNIIHIDNTFIYGDLRKMAARACDWNFCALHEMGHMFDMRRPWNFETECLTDLKLAYVLERNNVAASPSEFSASENFYGADIINAYRILSSDFSYTYDIFGCTERFLEIKADIGWNPFKQTFQYLQENAAAYTAYTPQQKLVEFVDLLTLYSGRNVKGYFTAAEWNTMLNACH